MDCFLGMPVFQDMSDFEKQLSSEILESDEVSFSLDELDAIPDTDDDDCVNNWFANEASNYYDLRTEHNAAAMASKLVKPSSVMPYVRGCTPTLSSAVVDEKSCTPKKSHLTYSPFKLVDKHEVKEVDIKREVKMEDVDDYDDDDDDFNELYELNESIKRKQRVIELKKTATTPKTAAFHIITNTKVAKNVQSAPQIVQNVKTIQTKDASQTYHFKVGNTRYVAQSKTPATFRLATSPSVQPKSTISTTTPKSLIFKGSLTKNLQKNLSAATNPFPKPTYSYSCLIAMALKNSRTGSLPVSEIYSFMCEHFPYFKTAPNGWKNSVRHNLSLNKCFEKIEKPAVNGAQRKGCLWAMHPEKITKMDDEVQKWSRKDPTAIRSAMQCPDQLEALERGELKYGKECYGDSDSEEIDTEPEELDVDAIKVEEPDVDEMTSRKNSTSSVADSNDEASLSDFDSVMTEKYYKQNEELKLEFALAQQDIYQLQDGTFAIADDLIDSSLKKRIRLSNGTNVQQLFAIAKSGEAVRTTARRKPQLILRNNSNSSFIEIKYDAATGKILN